MKDFTINLNDKYYPEADNWMWNYCTYLGKYKSFDGKQYDLGILLNANYIDGYTSLAVVYDNIPGSYISGDIKKYKKDFDKIPDFIKETIRRTELLNLI